MAREALVVFLISLVFLLFHISNPKTTLLDEVLYTGAAKAVVHGQADSNSEHPPLGKYLIGTGMLLAGDTPVGWRLMPAVFGASSLSVVFLWMSSLGRHVAWTAVVLIATNGFWFVMSRIAMLAIFELTFAVIGLYLLSEHKYWLSGAALGLAAACRWNALFALLLAFAYTVLHDKRIIAAIKLSVASACSYVVAWMPLIGLHPIRFLQAQIYIIHFHLHATGNPAIRDSWYHWPLHTTPLGGMNSLLANPLITVLGAISILALLRKGHLVAFAGVVFFLQWAITPRPFTYYYYYLDTLTMLSIAAAIILSRYQFTIGKQQVRLCVPVAVLSAAWFIMHYAAFSGLQSPYDTLLQF